MKKRVIGFYDYTVILTYLGMFMAFQGIIFAVKDIFPAALLFLAGSLVCDTMDGRVARAKKNRAEEEKQFGVQIDSLCDMVSFGIFPAVIFYCWGLESIVDISLLGFYCLCCVIRLGFFNVLAQNKDSDEPAAYHGLPVVGLALFVPAAWLIGLLVPEVIFHFVLRFMLVAFGLLYIWDFPVNKPKMWKLGILGLVFLVPLLLGSFLM